MLIKKLISLKTANMPIVLHTISNNMATPKKKVERAVAVVRV